MSKVRQLHNQAMALAQLGLVARQQDDVEQAENLARQAYHYEVQAANLIPNEPSAEPTRAILYRSAASLAYQSREFALAQQLIKQGLSGCPPPAIAQELKELAVQISEQQKAIKIEGILDYAESRQQNIIGVTTPDNQAYYVLVKEGIDDLVRLHFRQWITVVGQYDGQYIYPTKVQFRTL